MGCSTVEWSRELAPSPYFFLCRYTSLIWMCLHKLMNIHHCVFKIKKCHGHTDGRQNSILYYKQSVCVCVCGGGGGGITIQTKLPRAKVTIFRQASVAHLDAPSDWRPGGRGFNPHRGRQHSFVEIDHEIFSTVILSLPMIQEGQMWVSGERMCTILVNRLED